MPPLYEAKAALPAWKGDFRKFQNGQATRASRKPASQGSDPAVKGAYIDVSDRSLQVQLTLEAKITADSSLVRAIFVFAGFVSALERRGRICPRRFRMLTKSAS